VQLVPDSQTIDPIAKQYAAALDLWRTSSVPFQNLDFVVKPVNWATGISMIKNQVNGKVC
jgi:hypothetical protein